MITITCLIGEAGLPRPPALVPFAAGATPAAAARAIAIRQAQVASSAMRRLRCGNACDIQGPRLSLAISAATVRNDPAPMGAGSVNDSMRSGVTARDRRQCGATARSDQAQGSRLGQRSGTSPEENCPSGHSRGTLRNLYEAINSAGLTTLRRASHL